MARTLQDEKIGTHESRRKLRWSPSDGGNGADRWAVRLDYDSPSAKFRLDGVYKFQADGTIK